MPGVSQRKSKGAGGDPGALYDELLAVSLDLRWTWKIEARQVFATLDPQASPGALEWPHRLLLGLGRPTVGELLEADPVLAETARAVVEDFSVYAKRWSKSWFAKSHKRQRDLLVAYFAPEYALTDSLPIFAGGLGTVAAEHLKASSALGVPLVAVGLLYRGSSHQWLDREGRQFEAWEMMSPSQMPIEPARDPQGRALRVTVPLPGRDLQVAVHRARVGRTELYLLDAAVEANSVADRTLTARLYDSDVETRFAQELILGVGGIRALAALGLEPDLVHLNEGHSAFALLERIRRAMASEGLSFDEASSAVRPGIVFTTHTPVAAGHDYFDPEVSERFLAPYAAQLGIELDRLLSLGRYRADDRGDTFCPTIFALRMAGHRNGVSRLHGHVTRAQWSGLWPRLPLAEVPIGHVTNGVHLQSWTTSAFSELLTETVGSQWQSTPGDPAVWAKLVEVDDAALWRVKNEARAELVEFSRRRARQELARRHGPEERTTSVALLDPDFLTIGFVGRFVAYKRPTLLLSDPERLARLLKDPLRPVQIVFAGKAHPNDEVGKGLLRDMLEFARSYDVEDRVVFIVDFDTTMDRALSQGADVWLNTPRRPQEACGVGGMKAGMNGALSFSTVDGWWDEACEDADPAAPPIGFSIGTAGPYEDETSQNDFDAASLYKVLEEKIIPRFYERGADGVPHAWLASVKQSMSTLAPMWDALRMTREYTETYYLPGATRVRELRSGGAIRVRNEARELERLRRGWPELAVDVLGAFGERVDIEVSLGELDPADVRVQLWLSTEGPARLVDATLVERLGHRARYVGHLTGDDLLGRELEDSDSKDSDSDTHLAARVVPAARYGEPIPGLIVWSS